MKKAVKILGTCLLLSTTLPVLDGCSSGAMLALNAAANNIFLRKDVNLQEKNYAATDYLDQSIRNFVSKYQSIKVYAFSEADKQEISSEFGRLTAEQIGMRLGELGYNVSLSQVASPGNADLFPKTSRPEDFRLVGTYARKDQNMTVYIRVLRVSDGRIVGSFNYTTPINNEIADLSSAEPKVFRIEK